MFKLRLTDAICGPLAELIVAHNGRIESLHLSHNQITSKGAKLLCERIATVYPIKSNDGTLFTPLWLRLEHNKIDPSTFTLAPELYTVKQHRLRKLKPPAPPLQLPHIGLGDPAASQRARCTLLPGQQPSPGGGQGGGAGRPPKQVAGRGKPEGGEVGAEVGAVARALFYGDGRLYGCRLGPATDKGRMCIFIGYEGDGWQDTFAKDIKMEGGGQGGRGGGQAGGKPGGVQQQQGQGGKVVPNATGRRAGEGGGGGSARKQAAAPAVEGGSGGGVGGAGGVGVLGAGAAGAHSAGGAGGEGAKKNRKSKGKGSAGAATTGVASSPITLGGVPPHAAEAQNRSPLTPLTPSGAASGAPPLVAQMGVMSLQNASLPSPKNANAPGGLGTVGSPLRVEPTAMQHLEADLKHAQMMLRGSYRSPKGHEMALSNAVEARTFAEGAMWQFANAGDRDNGFRCLAVSGEARMREGFARVCRGEHGMAMAECCAKSVQALTAAKSMLVALEDTSGLTQQLQLSLDMACENAERCKRELAEKLAEAMDQVEVQVLRASLEAAISMASDLAKLR